ncbi:MAG: alpha/beta fold hydrolase, partial [bacterium]|nr:alpha/beta fold hydrolase [bacterium]
RKNGDSEALGRTSVNDYVADIVELIGHLREFGFIDPDVRPIIFGHSMGGLIAQKLSACGASSLTVLLNSAPPAGVKLHADLHYQLDIFRYLPKMLAQKPFLPSLKIFSRYIMNGMPPEIHAALYKGAVHESGRAALEIRFGKINVDFSAIDCPMLIIGAENDRIIPHRIAIDIGKKITTNVPHEVWVYEKFAHWIQVEQGLGWRRPANDIYEWILSHLNV